MWSNNTKCLPVLDAKLLAKNSDLKEKKSGLERNDYGKLIRKMVEEEARAEGNRYPL